MSLDCHLFAVQLPHNTHAASNPMIRTEDLLRVTTPLLNCIATAVLEHNVYDAFLIFVDQIVADPRQHARQGQRRCAMRFSRGLTAETMCLHGVQWGGGDEVGV